jgi:tRNA modification GTPase
VRRALERAEQADLRLGLVDAGAEAGEAAKVMSALKPFDILVITKLDLSGGRGLEESQALYEHYGLAAPHLISVRTGLGLAHLEASLEAIVGPALSARQAPALTRLRHSRLVEEALAGLRRAVPALDRGPELAAEDLRGAAAALGRLTGRIDVEDLLDEVFASFCIGK